MDITDVMQKLAETDAPAAEASSQAKMLDRNLKIVRAHEFLKAEGTVAERESKAYSSEAYKAAHNALSEAEANDLLLRNERSTNTMRFEYWRSMNANRRQGGGNL